MIEQDEFSEVKTWLPITLRNARTERGLSQKQLARLSNVGEKTISSFESGARPDRISLLQMLRIAKALHTTIDALLAKPLAEARSFAAEPKSAPAPQFKRPRPVTLLPFSDFHRSSLGQPRR